MTKLTPTQQDAAVSRHGWAALLSLLQDKGVITEQEAQAVIMKAHRGAELVAEFGIHGLAEPLSEAAPISAQDEAWAAAEGWVDAKPTPDRP